MESTSYILAGTLIDGTGAEPRRNVSLAVDNGIIVEIAAAATLPNDASVFDLREYSVVPGLINMHAHLTLPGDGTLFEDWMALPDEYLLLKAHDNALTALRSGVTTIRDCGGKGGLTFRLREAIRGGIVPGPRLVLSGRPLTITGGHCHYFGGEADGPEGMRRAARQLLKEGADFIKIMASGGGTIGTYSQFPSFEVGELRAAIAEAHHVGKPASCHCIATESIARAVDAGVDHIEHCTFLSLDPSARFDEANAHNTVIAPDAVIRIDEELAQRVADKGVFVTATLQVIGDLPSGSAARYAQGQSSAEEALYVEYTARRLADHLATIGHLHELGARVVAGSDAGWRDTGFDDFHEELGYLERAGLTALEAIHAATGRAAEACHLAETIGTLQVGRVADLVAVKDDPLASLSALREPALVMQGGRIVVDRLLN